MKMIMIVCDSGAESLVEEALDAVGAEGWTRISDVSGKGRTGKRLGDPVFPGRNIVTFAVVKDEQVQPLTELLHKVPDEFIKQLSFRVFISDCETLI